MTLCDVFVLGAETHDQQQHDGQHLGDGYTSRVFYAPSAVSSGPEVHRRVI